MKPVGVVAEDILTLIAAGGGVETPTNPFSASETTV